MANSALIQVHVDEETKRKADRLFAELGIDTPTAIRIFLNQSISSRKMAGALAFSPCEKTEKREGMSFDVGEKLPNAETVAAIDDVNNNRGMSRAFDSIVELMEDLNA